MHLPLDLRPWCSSENHPVPHVHLISLLWSRVVYQTHVRVKVMLKSAIHDTK